MEDLSLGQPWCLLERLHKRLCGLSVSPISAYMSLCARTQPLRTAHKAYSLTASLPRRDSLVNLVYCVLKVETTIYFLEILLP